MRTLSQTTKQRILAELPKDAQPTAQLRNGRQVVGRHVDSDNHLHFVVRDASGKIEVINAQGIGVARFLGKPRSHTVTITNPVAMNKQKSTNSANPELKRPSI